MSILIREQTLFGGVERSHPVRDEAGSDDCVVVGSLFSNEPDLADPEPFNANGITFNDADDGGAGGNYSGTGKLSSAAPKQVIVNITNLLSVEAIQLLDSEAGQSEKIQNLKEQMAQALIDVVHDFDQSWSS